MKFPCEIIVWEVLPRIRAALAEELNEEPCGKPQGINSHITNTTAVTLWQATGNFQVKKL
jgi:hypothetical protein